MTVTVTVTVTKINTPWPWPWPVTVTVTVAIQWWSWLWAIVAEVQSPVAMVFCNKNGPTWDPVLLQESVVGERVMVSTQWLANIGTRPVHFLALATFIVIAKCTGGPGRSQSDFLRLKIRTCLYVVKSAYLLPQNSQTHERILYTYA